MDTKNLVMRHDVRVDRWVSVFVVCCVDWVAVLKKKMDCVVLKSMSDVGWVLCQKVATYTAIEYGVSVVLEKEWVYPLTGI